LTHDHYQELAQAVIRERNTPADGGYTFHDATYPHWGEEIDADTFSQMNEACSLPVAVKGALMPDAHVGYGLPIGGVLATKDAVIPYAVGIDIACRVMVSIYDMPASELKRNRTRLEQILYKNTQFGLGADWERPKNHEVMDQDWDVTPRTSTLKDKAWRQLGTSGSGNHFVEFGEISFPEDFQGVPAGEYVALVSHSGSRGPGAKVALHYCALAQDLHPKLPGKKRHLAWLDMNAEGAEYWEAMQLMGAYASANHHVIHRDISKALSQNRLAQFENHHNFAWKEVHGGEELIVHRKGATPAAKGEIGYIPGSMLAPGFLVEGLGNEESLCSSAHGAGRLLSRKQAKRTTTMHALKKLLHENGVWLMSAGLDEAPHAYKDIRAVMAAQEDLVEKRATFQPRVVRMAPDEDERQ
ncbi:MAG: RtcB family protein, partial [Bdellovibrionales bacterium]|nr:RtcB family protein [Bdellovibrionales bacterium]